MMLDKKLMLDKLVTMTTRHLAKIGELQQLTDAELERRNQDGQWNTLENIEHLNRYAEFYVPRIQEAVNRAQLSSRATFESGYLGNMFAKSMLPRKQMKKINTFKSKNPAGANLSRDVLDTLAAYLKSLLAVLELGHGRELDSVKATSTIPLVRLKVGDALRVVIHHHERHFVQIDGLLQSVTKSGI